MATTYTWDGSSSGVWNTAANWTAGANYPGQASNDVAVFDYLGTGTAVAGQDVTAIGSINMPLTALHIRSTYTKAFGDATTAVKVGATTIRIGDASGSATAGAGSGRINLNAHTDATTIYVNSTATESTDDGQEPVRIVAVNAANSLIVYGGRVGVATNAATDVATFGTISCLGADAFVHVAAGVTLTTFRQTAGEALVYCAATTVRLDGGTLSTFGSGAITTVYCNGLANLNSTGTITTLEIQPAGHANFLNSTQARTVTTVKMYAGSTLSYNPATTTISNPIQLVQCRLSDVTINVPPSCTVAIVAV